MSTDGDRPGNRRRGPADSKDVQRGNCCPNHDFLRSQPSTHNVADRERYTRQSDSLVQAMEQFVELASQMKPFALPDDYCSCYATESLFSNYQCEDEQEDKVRNYPFLDTQATSISAVQVHCKVGKTSSPRRVTIKGMTDREQNCSARSILNATIKQSTKHVVKEAKSVVYTQEVHLEQKQSYDIIDDNEGSFHSCLDGGQIEDHPKGFGASTEKMKKHDEARMNHKFQQTLCPECEEVNPSPLNIKEDTSASNKHYINKCLKNCEGMKVKEPEFIKVGELTHNKISEESNGCSYGIYKRFVKNKCVKDCAGMKGKVLEFKDSSSSLHKISEVSKEYSSDFTKHFAKENKCVKDCAGMKEKVASSKGRTQKYFRDKDDLEYSEAFLDNNDLVQAEALVETLHTVSAITKQLHPAQMSSDSKYISSFEIADETVKDITYPTSRKSKTDSILSPVSEVEKSVTTYTPVAVFSHANGNSTRYSNVPALPVEEVLNAIHYLAVDIEPERILDNLRVDCTNCHCCEEKNSNTQTPVESLKSSDHKIELETIYFSDIMSRSRHREPSVSFVEERNKFRSPSISINSITPVPSHPASAAQSEYSDETIQSPSIYSDFSEKEPHYLATLPKIEPSIEKISDESRTPIISRSESDSSGDSPAPSSNSELEESIVSPISTQSDSSDDSAANSKTEDVVKSLDTQFADLKLELSYIEAQLHSGDSSVRTHFSVSVGVETKTKSTSPSNLIEHKDISLSTQHSSLDSKSTHFSEARNPTTDTFSIQLPSVSPDVTEKIIKYQSLDETFLDQAKSSESTQSDDSSHDDRSGDRVSTIQDSPLVNINDEKAVKPVKIGISADIIKLHLDNTEINAKTHNEKSNSKSDQVRNHDTTPIEKPTTTGSKVVEHETTTLEKHTTISFITFKLDTKPVDKSTSMSSEILKHDSKTIDKSTTMSSKTLNTMSIPIQTSKVDQQENFSEIIKAVTVDTGVGAIPIPVKKPIKLETSPEEAILNITSEKPKLQSTKMQTSATDRDNKVIETSNPKMFNAGVNDTESMHISEKANFRSTQTSTAHLMSSTENTDHLMIFEITKTCDLYTTIEEVVKVDNIEDTNLAPLFCLQQRSTSSTDTKCEPCSLRVSSHRTHKKAKMKALMLDKPSKSVVEKSSRLSKKQFTSACKTDSFVSALQDLKKLAQRLSPDLINVDDCCKGCQCLDNIKYILKEVKVDEQNSCNIVKKTNVDVGVSSPLLDECTQACIQKVSVATDAIPGNYIECRTECDMVNSTYSKFIKSVNLCVESEVRTPAQQCIAASVLGGAKSDTTFLETLAKVDQATDPHQQYREAPESRNESCSASAEMKDEGNQCQPICKDASFFVNLDADLKEKKQTVNDENDISRENHELKDSNDRSCEFCRFNTAKPPKFCTSATGGHRSQHSLSSHPKCYPHTPPPPLPQDMCRRCKHQQHYYHQPQQNRNAIELCYPKPCTSRSVLKNSNQHELSSEISHSSRQVQLNLTPTGIYKMLCPEYCSVPNRTVTTFDDDEYLSSMRTFPPFGMLKTLDLLEEYEEQCRQSTRKNVEQSGRNSKKEITLRRGFY